MKHYRFIRHLIMALLLVSGLWFLIATQSVQAQVPGPENLAICSTQETRYHTVLTPTQDAHVNEVNPNANYSATTNLRVGKISFPSAGDYYTFLAFDMSSLPADAVIMSATLELYQTLGSGFDINAHVVTETWSEAGITWNTQPGITMQDEVGEGIPVDDWHRWDLTTIAQQWYAGTLTNHGVRLSFNFGLINTRDFASREAASNSPRLVIEYQRRATFQVQADTTISQGDPTGNFGSTVNIDVSRNVTTANESHALLQFDLSSIPSGSTIVSATLALQGMFNRILATPTEPQVGIAISPTANLDSWDEMAVSWSNAPLAESQGDPTSTYVDGGATIWDVTRIVQAWSSGILLNYGFSLKPAFGEYGSASFVAAPSPSQAILTLTYGPPRCYAVSDVNIGGATQGVTDTVYTFTANITPPTATLPITYTWEATEQTSASGPSAEITYTWALPGWKTITVTVENCESSVVDTHQVSITVPIPACTPLTSLNLAGPTEGITGTAYTFTAAVTPPDATLPITYTWEADGQTPVSGTMASAAFTWDTTGTKHITITAQNCGGAFVAYHTVNVVSAAQLPDLTISGIWYVPDEGRVYYIVKNVGRSTVPAGFSISLTQAVSEVAQSTFPEALQPGWVRAGSLDYAWMCDGSAADAIVCADVADSVLEGNEANNCFQETWICDLAPPFITAEPTINATEHVVTITWQTNEPCRSRLDYSRSGPINTVSAPNDTYTTEHQITLDALFNATTYWYRIHLTDEAGNQGASHDLYFETQPPGTDPPVIVSYDIQDYTSTSYEFYKLTAIMGDAAGIDHVSFYVNGHLVSTDYTPNGNTYEAYYSPAEDGMPRDYWFNDDKAKFLRVWAWNLEGEDVTDAKLITPTLHPMPGKAVIAGPDPDATISVDDSILRASVYGSQYEWKCTETASAAYWEVPPGLSPVLCADVAYGVAKMRMYIDGSLMATYTPFSDEFSHWFNLSLAGRGLGIHTLRFAVEVSSGDVISSEEVSFVMAGQPELDFDRTATRKGNAIEVTLTVSNTGTATAYVDYIEDFARGFQVIETDFVQTTNQYRVRNDDYGDMPERTIMIDLFSNTGSEIALAPGEAYAIKYQLVPVFYPQFEYHYIGAGPLPEYGSRILYRRAGVEGTFGKAFKQNSNWVDHIYVDSVVADIAAASDYILVTSPAGLRWYTLPIDWRHDLGTQRELSVLLSRMAELATLKNGVLGFLPANPSADTLDALLEKRNGQWGYWASMLHSNFRGNKGTGYVLFVGEQEIIPAQDAGYGVHYSDLRYASTSGVARPELVLGRIVGNDLGTLSNALYTSILFHRDGFGFDRSHAVVTSGTDETRENNDFRANSFAAANIMQNAGGFDVRHIRWAVENTPTPFDVLKNAVAATHPDVIVYYGHGTPDSWAGLTSGQVPELDFGDSRPVGVGFTCSSGNYEDPTDDYSLPEAWLRYDGAVYIGASQTSYSPPDSDAVKLFFTRWELVEMERNVGQVLTYLKRDKWSTDYGWKRFTYEYHLLGDPKYGAMETQLMQPALAPAATQVVTTLHVILPDFEVITTSGGIDLLEIPDGEILSEEGEYRVPYWKVVATYPQGQRVQDVMLTAQSGLVVTTGLHISTTTTFINCDCTTVPNVQESTRLQSTSAITGWSPQFERDYEWQVVENPDGTSTLELRVYPFTYNPSTTDARYYKDWSFNIDVFTATVDIMSLGTPQAAYYLTETVTATLLIHNDGAAQPVIVQPVVKSLSDEVVAALPLRTLHAISGTAVLDIDAPALVAGVYVLDVALADTEGRVLDTEVAEFVVGIAAGAVTSLTATPTQFQVGDNVGITMTFQNTGDVPLDGTAIIRVQMSDGMTQTAEFTHTLTALLPGATHTFNDVWDTTDAPDVSDYRVTGYVKFNNAVSEAAYVDLVTAQQHTIYLPLILRNR